MEKKVNWQICQIKGQELAEELKRMANDVERVALVKEILDTMISKFIASKAVARVYQQELLDEFICEGDGVKWAVIAYRISFFGEFMKGSRVKKRVTQRALRYERLRPRMETKPTKCIK